MAMFSASGLKIERAEMRISELDTFVTSFASATGLYSVQIEKADAIMPVGLRRVAFGLD